jgi:hypothetical protein
MNDMSAERRWEWRRELEYPVRFRAVLRNHQMEQQVMLTPFLTPRQWTSVYYAGQRVRVTALYLAIR